MRVFVRALAVPALTGFFGYGNGECTAIFCTHCGTFAAIISSFIEENEDVMKVNYELMECSDAMHFTVTIPLFNC